MALRYMAGRIGVPALRRAPGSRLAQPAGAPRRLFSSSHLGGHDNGARKPSTDVDLDRLHAEFAAECEALREAFKREQKSKRFVIGTCLTGVSMALLTMLHTAYTEMQRARRLRSKMLKQKWREPGV